MAAGRKAADGGLENVARQSLGPDMQVVQKDVKRPLVLGRPSAEAGQQVALAHAGFAPQHHADAASFALGGLGVPGQLAKLAVVDGQGIDARLRRIANAVLGERVGILQVIEEVRQRRRFRRGDQGGGGRHHFLRETT